MIRKNNWLILTIGIIGVGLATWCLTSGIRDLIFVGGALVFLAGIALFEGICNLIAIREIHDSDLAIKILREKITKASERICITTQTLNPRIYIDNGMEQIIKRKAKEGVWIEIISGKPVSKKALSAFRGVLSLPNFKLYETDEYVTPERIVLPDTLETINLKEENGRISITIFRSIQGAAGTGVGHDFERYKEKASLFVV